MAKCPHCKTEVQMITEKQYYCNFCELDVIVQEEVKPYQFRGTVDYVDAAKPTKDLMSYHTFDLLLLLRFSRKERRDNYQLMQTIGVMKNTSKEFAEGYQEAFELYDYWTKKTRVLESLVKERIGTIPKAVSNELLDKFYSVFQDTTAAVGY